MKKLTQNWKATHLVTCIVEMCRMSLICVSARLHLMAVDWVRLVVTLLGSALNLMVDAKEETFLLLLKVNGKV